MFRSKLFIELSSVGRLFTKLVLLFFCWVLNGLFKSARMEVRQTRHGVKQRMFGIKVHQFKKLAILCEFR